MSDSEYATEFNPGESVIDQLFERIRMTHRSVLAHECLTLDMAVSAGAYIIEARARGASMKSICEKCALPRSTASLYQQLAEHRAEIKAKRRENPNLSMNGARRLIAQLKKAQSKDGQEDATGAAA